MMFGILYKSTNRFLFKVSIVVVLICNVSCKKIVEIDPPKNLITTDQAFKDSASANSAILGLYKKISAVGLTTFSGNITIYCGMYSDELTPYVLSNGLNNPFYSNVIPVTINPSIWDESFQIIYQANACIEGIESSSFKETVKKQLLSEAKFIRALVYFYLSNLYGDLPLMTTTSWSINANKPRIKVADIYQQLIVDLSEAEANLNQDYSLSGGERVRANKWVAAALLARVYLYAGNWSSAEMESSKVIANSGMYSLNSDLTKIFTKNNQESLLQWKLNTAETYGNLTPEGQNFNGLPNGMPFYYLSTQLLNDFETGDVRKTAWVKKSTYLGSDYWLANKYKIGIAQFQQNGSSSEYYTIFRLAEQYLIRADARAKQNNLAGAIADVNTIRSRASLTNLSNSLTQQQVIDAILQERRIEFFAEWGHRWLDLKRTDKADVVMTIVTPLKAGQTWAPFRKLWPINFDELKKSPSMVQNPGY